MSKNGNICFFCRRKENEKDETEEGDGRWKEKSGETSGSPSWRPSTSPTDTVSACSCPCSRSQRHSHAGPAAGRDRLVRHCPYRVVMAPGCVEEKFPPTLVPTTGLDKSTPRNGLGLSEGWGGKENNTVNQVWGEDSEGGPSTFTTLRSMLGSMHSSLESQKQCS